jgi:hypothetical protein
MKMKLKLYIYVNRIGPVEAHLKLEKNVLLTNSRIAKPCIDCASKGFARNRYTAQGLHRSATRSPPPKKNMQMFGILDEAKADKGKTKVKFDGGEAYGR